MALAQNDDAFGDTRDPGETDKQDRPFWRGMNWRRPSEPYEEAIKVRPEFPEAEFQRANELVTSKRLVDAQSGFRMQLNSKKIGRFPTLRWARCWSD